MILLLLISEKLYIFVQIVDIMEDRVGEPLSVVVIRGHDNKSITLTVTPQEANPDVR